MVAASAGSSDVGSAGAQSDGPTFVVRGVQLRSHAALALFLAATTFSFALGGRHDEAVRREVCDYSNALAVVDGQIQQINSPSCHDEVTYDDGREPFVAVAGVAGLALVGALVLRRARQRVVADMDGLAIRNFLRTRRVGWSDVVGIVLADRRLGLPPVMAATTATRRYKLAATESRTRDRAATTFAGLATRARAAGVPVAADIDGLLTGAPRPRCMGVVRRPGRAVIGWPWRAGIGLAVWPPAAVAIEAFGVGDQADADGVSRRGTVGVVAVVIVALVLQYRVSRIGLVLDRDAVTTRRLLHGRRVAWRDVREISVASSVWGKGDYRPFLHFHVGRRRVRAPTTLSGRYPRAAAVHAAVAEFKPPHVLFDVGIDDMVWRPLPPRRHRAKAGR